MNPASSNAPTLPQLQQWLQQGRARETWQALRGIALEALDVERLYLRGVAAGMCGEIDDARAAITACLTVAPKHAGALFQWGVLAAADGRLEAARDAFAAAAAAVPGWADVHYNLAVVHSELGDRGAAEAAYRVALRVRPDLVQAANNLANLLVERGAHGEAIALLQQALALQPGFAIGWYTLGCVLLDQQREREAAQCLARAVQLDPTHADAWDLLAAARHQSGDLAGAEQACHRALQLAPSESARFRLAVLRGEALPRPPDEFVRQVFDRLAGKFDQHLVDVLGYRLPFELEQHLSDLLGAPRSLDVLDLGCGTGLAGVALRPWARRLVGVDLSPQMLERARQRGVYDTLTEAPLQQVLDASDSAAWDLLLAADVFVYVGALEPVFAAARRLLRPDGRLLFSVEAAEGENLVLQPTGRYAHPRSYVERVAAAAGLRVERCEHFPLRREKGTMLDGLLFRLRPA